MRRIESFDPETGLEYIITAASDGTDDFYLTNLHVEVIKRLIDSIAEVNSSKLECSSDMEWRERTLWSVAQYALNSIDDY